MSLSTPAQRNASFAPYHNAKVGEESVRDYLILRSAFLVEAERVEITTNSPGYHFAYFATNGMHHGMATAIDQRGYFLTAAHCVEKDHYWLVFLRDRKTQVERPRIVWRGDVKKGEPDLAILCVSRPLSERFEWAAEFTNGSHVVDAGLSIDVQSHRAEAQCMAGSVLNVSEALSADSLGYTVVSHSSPLRPGDSGGPLVLSDGRLLGINFFVRLNFQWSHLSFEQHSEAHRPDLVWLRKLIDADAALFPREISSP